MVGRKLKRTRGKRGGKTREEWGPSPAFPLYSPLVFFPLRQIFPRGLLSERLKQATGNFL